MVGPPALLPLPYGRGKVKARWQVPRSPRNTPPKLSAWVARAMRVSLRLVIPLLLALAAIAYAVLPLVDKLTLRWFTRDLEPEVLARVAGGR